MQKFAFVRVQTLTCAGLACLALATVGCKKEEPKPVEPPKTEAPAAEPVAEKPPAEASPTAAPAAASPTAAPAAASPTTVDAATLLQPGVRFMFDLEASPDAKKNAEAMCDGKAAGDAAKKDACMGEIAKAAIKEGIRFDKEGDQWFFVSFGTKDDGSDELFMRCPIAKAESPANIFAFSPTGDCTGPQAVAMDIAKFDAAKAAAMKLTVEVVDATTVAMPAPPPKGRLVYHKK